MRFEAVIGNPPYQVKRGGTKNVDIWPDIIRVANAVADTAVVVHPARWIVPKKKMMPVRDELLCEGLNFFDFYPDSSELFPGQAIDSGVSITSFRKGYASKVTYSVGGEGDGEYKPDEAFCANQYEKEIFEKLSAQALGQKSIEHRVLGNAGSLGGGEYGYKKESHIHFLKDTPQGMQDPIPIWANADYGKGTRFAWHYVDKKKINPIPPEVLKSRKLMLDKKGNVGKKESNNIINNIPQIVEKKAIASGDVFFVIPEHDELVELENLRAFFMTKTVRYLLTLIQRDLYVRGFNIIPDYVYFLPTLGNQQFSDEWFYKTFKFSDALIEDIESKISEKCLKETD